MSEITRYVLVDHSDNEDDYEYERFDEARDEAIRRGDHAVLERTYSYEDQTLAWAPDDADTWPPKQ